MMHGTAEAIEKMREKFADEMRPLADMLGAFASNGSKTLSDAEVAELDTAILTIRRAIENVRANGLEIGGSRTEVDRTILKEMDGILDAAKQRLDDAIAYAKQLGAKGKVFDEGDWMDERKLSAMAKTKDKLKIVKSDGTETTISTKVKDVQNYLETNTPSMFKRDFFDQMFD